MSSKISQLNALAKLTGREDLLVAYNGANWRVPVSLILSSFNLSSIKLDQVDNTSDLNKPISNATKEALDNKADKNHKHVFSDVEGLSKFASDVESALNVLALEVSKKLNADVRFAIADIAGLADALASKASSTHTHSYAIADIADLKDVLDGLRSALSNKADSMHSHDAANISGLPAYVDQRLQVVQGTHQW